MPTSICLQDITPTSSSMRCGHCLPPIRKSERAPRLSSAESSSSSSRQGSWGVALSRDQKSRAFVWAVGSSQDFMGGAAAQTSREGHLGRIWVQGQRLGPGGQGGRHVCSSLRCDGSGHAWRLQKGSGGKWH